MIIFNLEITLTNDWSFFMSLKKIISYSIKFLQNFLFIKLYPYGVRCMSVSIYLHVILMNDLSDLQVHRPSCWLSLLL